MRSLLESRAIRRWLGWAMLCVVVVCLALWHATRETLPRQIRIATASSGGLYYETGRVLAGQLATRSGRAVRVLETEGSVANRELLLRGDAELALLQLGAVPEAGIAALAPLYPDVVHVIVRKQRGIRTVHDLEGRVVIVGAPGSGMRGSAAAILDHYRMRTDPGRIRLSYFAELASDPEVDAAIVTTGFANPDLNRLLNGGGFELLPILDADALAIRLPYFSPLTIPRGLYGERPAVPEAPVRTVATTTFLAAAADASSLLVTETLAALHENSLQSQIPGLATRREAAQWSEIPLHEAARAYYDPYRGLGLVANFMETLAAIKELLFALGAGLYLAWSWWRRLLRRERRAEVRGQKERLDELLEETVCIERLQMSASDPRQLRRFLDEITRIKLRALTELTHEELRGDRLFSIFLSQCSSLSRKIEAKLEAAARGHPFALSTDPGSESKPLARAFDPGDEWPP